MKKYLEIVLKSDICIGSGYSYAGIVDTDSCFDRFGIPVIPARRLKGCLREAAECIGESPAIFGCWGQDSAEKTPVLLSDAYIGGYRGITEALEQLAADGKGEPFFSPDRIRQCYSRVKAQTAIDENGAASENTLRFMRIVNHYDLQKEELRFYAEIILRDGDDRSEEILRRAAKALRHIGENRTRGLGNVRCTLLSEEEAQKRIEKKDIAKEADVSIKNEEMLKDSGGTPVVLKYTIRTEAPLVISTEDDKNSETYINGRSVLGYFAGAYLKKTGKPADSVFENLFLKDRLLFSPLYPSSASGNAYTPAPAWMAKLKKSGEIVNISLQKLPQKEDEEYGEKVQNGRYYPGNGNQPKKLKGKYVSFVNGVPDIREVETEIIYHHRHESESAEEQLYAVNAVRPGQYFSGSITGEAEAVKIMAELLTAGSLRFGKSKSAQYGRCSLVSAEVSAAENPEDRISCRKGDRLLVTLQSDGLFLDEETGNYTVRTEEIRGQVFKSTEDFLRKSGLRTDEGFLEADGEQGSSGMEENEKDSLYGEIEVKQLSGHYGVWNLRRTSIPCVCAGTTFEYRAGCDFEIPGGVILTGTGNGEGFGVLKIVKNTGKWLVGEKTGDTADEKQENEKSGEEQKNGEVKWQVPDALQILYRESLKAELYRRMEKKALQVTKGGLSASATGRITLMLTECINENIAAPEKVREELEKRIRSVKDKEKQKAALGFVRKYYDGAFDEESAYCQTALGRLPDEESRRSLEEACRLYCLEQALVMLKYKNKEES